MPYHDDIVEYEDVEEGYEGENKIYCKCEWCGRLYWLKDRKYIGVCPWCVPHVDKLVRSIDGDFE